MIKAIDKSNLAETTRGRRGLGAAPLSGFCVVRRLVFSWWEGSRVFSIPSAAALGLLADLVVL